MWRLIPKQATIPPPIIDPPDMTQTQPDVIVVTGSASNIGLAIARRFSRKFCVVGMDAKYAASSRTSADFIETYCDVADPTSVMQAFKFARQQGPIKGVIHSAAITEARCAVVDTPLEVWQRLIAVNLTGTFIVVKTAVPYLLETKGTGVLLSSRAGKAGYAGFDPSPMGTKSAYSASKAGVISLVKSLAIELAPAGVRINGIAPGSIEGTMIPQEKWAELARSIPLKRLGRPEEIAEAAFYLCSDEASYITGHILDVNGGTLMD
jgi:3-oxoacyl-[acyl-carrier protein] reductase